MRIIGKIVMIIAIIVVILLSVLSFFLFTDFGHQKITDIVNDKVVNGEIHFEKLKLNLFEFSVEIKNLEIFTPDNNSVISVENIKTAVDFHTLVSQKKILIKYLEINNVIVNLKFDGNGNLILAEAFVNPDDLQEEEKKEFNLDEFLEIGIFDLFANSLEIRNAAVNFEKDKILVGVSGANVFAQNIDLRKLSLDLQVNTENVSAKIDTMDFVLDTFSLKLSGSQELINLNELFAVSFVNDTVSLSAIVKTPAKLDYFALSLTANSSLNSLQNYNIQVLPKENSLNLHTKIELSGNLSEPVANIEIIAAQIDVLDYSADDISTKIYIDNETLMTENLSVKNINAMNFNGDVFLNASANLKSLFPNGLTGGFDTAGLALEEISAKADMKVSVREKTINETVNLTAKAELQKAVAKIDFLKINARNRDLLEITGTYGILNERINANLQLLPTNISEFNNILKTPVENAVVSATATVNGTVLRPNISTLVSVKDIRAFDIWADNLAVSAKYSGNLGKGSGEIAINLDTLTSIYQNISQLSSNISIEDSVINLESLSLLIGEDDSVQLSGNYKLNGEYSADLKIPDLNFKDIAAISEQQIFGRGKIAVSAEGNINKNPLPKTANLSIEIDTIDYAPINNLGFATHQNIYAKIEENEIFPSANGIINIDGGKIVLNEKGEVKISQVPVILENAAKIMFDGEVSGEDISLKTDGEIILQRFTHFVAEFLDSVAGEIKFGAEISGKTANPEINASVNLQEISGKILLLEQNLHNLSGIISYKNKTVEIENLDGKIDNGNFAVAGKIDLTVPQKPLGTANITLENLFLNYPDMANITIDGNVSAEFTPNSAAMHGNIDILNAVYFQDIDANILSISGITRQNGAFENLGGAISLRHQRESAFPVDLNLTIHPRGKIFVENNLAEMSLIPDITIGGTTQFPSVSGRVRVNDGEVFFNNRTFEVLQGIIDFSDPYAIRPEVDISAETTIQNYRITLNISGDPQSELLFSFTSSPHLEDQDILSLILFGRIGSNLDELQGDAVNMLINNMLGNVGPSGVNISYKDNSVAVSLSKNLSRKISVGYHFETIRGEPVQTGSLIWKLSDFLKIKGYSDTRNQAGVGLEAEFERR